MKRIFVDIWENGQNEVHRIDGVKEGHRVFANNYNPPTHFIEVWKMIDGRTNQVNSLFGSVLPSSLPKPIEKIEDCGDKRTIAIFKIRPRH